MTKDEALKQALEVLMEHGTAYLGHSKEYQQAIIKSKEALAQPSDSVEQEPDGYVQTVIEALYENGDPVSVDAAELLQRITAQPEQEPFKPDWLSYRQGKLDGAAESLEETKREWVGLTEEEFQWCGDENFPMIRVAEMLKEKNT